MTAVKEVILANPEESKKNGRLLNEAILKYRIEKKDIERQETMSRFGSFAGSPRNASQSQFAQFEIGEPENVAGKNMNRSILHKQEI